MHWLRITVYWIIDVLEDDRCIFQRFSMSHPGAEERKWVARNQQWGQALKLKVYYLLFFYCSFISLQENSLEVKKVCICLCSKLHISWYLLHSKWIIKISAHYWIISFFGNSVCTSSCGNLFLRLYLLPAQ